MKPHLLPITTCLLLAMVPVGGVIAQPYPTKPVRMIVGFAAGAAIDASCRMWADKLAKRLAQPFVVENRPGAGGEIATKQVATSPPDGATLGCISSGVSVASAKPNARLDARQELQPVIQMTRLAFAIYVNPTLPVRSMQELIAYAKANPGKLNYGSTGVGGASHMGFELLKSVTGIDVVHVPFKSSSQSTMAVIGGETQVAMDTFATVKAQATAGKVRILAASTARRFSAVPEYPGMEESGVPGYSYTSWSGVAGPAGMPRAITDRLNLELSAILKEPDTLAFFQKQGYEVVGGSADDFRQAIAGEIAEFAALIRKANISFD